MKFGYLSLFFAAAAKDIEVSEEMKKINEKVFEDTKKFYWEQFQPFEETGWTKEMIQGAKEIYFAKDFSEKMGGQGGMAMQLWTISNGKVYVEENPYQENDYWYTMQMNEWGDTIKYGMSSNLFPRNKTIQFWTHVSNDTPKWDAYDGRRLDLLHPSMWYDNERGKWNAIVHPNGHTFQGH